MSHPQRATTSDNRLELRPQLGARRVQVHRAEPERGRNKLGEALSTGGLAGGVRVLGITSGGQDAMSAIGAAAAKYGINPEAMMAASYAESGFHTNEAGGGLLFQFESGTFKSDYEALDHKAPTEAAQDYSASVQAQVAAAAMKRGGIGSELLPRRHRPIIVARFEKPTDTPGTKYMPGQPTGYEGDMSRGGEVVSTVGNQISQAAEKADPDSKTHLDNIPKSVHGSLTEARSAVDETAPLLPKDIAEALNTLIDDADTVRDAVQRQSQNANGPGFHRIERRR